MYRARWFTGHLYVEDEFTRTQLNSCPTQYYTDQIWNISNLTFWWNLHWNPGIFRPTEPSSQWSMNRPDLRHRGFRLVFNGPLQSQHVILPRRAVVTPISPEAETTVESPPMTSNTVSDVLYPQRLARQTGARNTTFVRRGFSSGVYLGKQL